VETRLIAGHCSNCNAPWEGIAYVLELLLQRSDHVLLDNDTLLVEILDYVVMVVAIDVDNDGFDGWVALNEHACDTHALAGILGRM
jgi:hypothetical protein